MADAPNQGPSAVVNQLKQLWGEQSRGRRLLAVLVVLGIVGVVVFTRFINKPAGWTIVADGASPDDSQELISVLEQRGIQGRLTGGKVEVRDDKIDQARSIAAAAGLPRVGKGFELFDGSHLGQSSFAEQVNFRRGLQGELARSITSMAQVQGARVHLALGKRSVFKDRDEAATASVALHMHAGQQLTPEQVRGIRQMVAASVEGLRPDAVVVVDNHGNLLDGAEPNAVNKSAAIELATTSRVRQILERVVGAGKVNVVTTAVVDDSQISETQEVFDNANPVLRSESRVVEGANLDTLNGVGGVAGTRGNLPGATPGAGAGAPSGASGNGRLQETKNFEISRTVRQVRKPEAQLSKLYLAVIVDYKTGADGKPAARSDKELAELTSLARQAAGIDDARGDKIDLRSIPFIADEIPAADVAAAGAPPVESLLPVPMPVAIGAGAGLLLLIAIVIFVMRGKKRDKRIGPKNLTLALPAPVSELERVLDARQHDDNMALAKMPHLAEPPALPGQTTRDRVLTAVKSDVDRAAEVLTAWLSEPPPKTVAAKGARA